MRKLREDFGPRVRSARETAGFTQKQLGNRVGVSSTTIARIERGEQGIRESTLMGLAEHLGKAPAYFYSSEAPSQVTTPNDLLRECLAILLGLNREGLESAVDVLKEIGNVEDEPEADPEAPSDGPLRDKDR